MNSDYECKSCWWQEGGLCYVDKPPLDKDGRSLIIAEKKCEQYRSKRSVLSVIPNEKLVIVSELT